MVFLVTQYFLNHLGGTHHGWKVLKAEVFQLTLLFILNRSVWSASLAAMLPEVTATLFNSIGW